MVRGGRVELFQEMKKWILDVKGVENLRMVEGKPITNNSTGPKRVIKTILSWKPRFPLWNSFSGGSCHQQATAKGK